MTCNAVVQLLTELQESAGPSALRRPLAQRVPSPRAGTPPAGLRGLRQRTSRLWAWRHIRLMSSPFNGPDVRPGNCKLFSRRHSNQRLGLRLAVTGHLPPVFPEDPKGQVGPLHTRTAHEANKPSPVSVVGEGCAREIRPPSADSIKRRSSRNSATGGPPMNWNCRTPQTDAQALTSSAAVPDGVPY